MHDVASIFCQALGGGGLYNAGGGGAERGKGRAVQVETNCNSC